MAHDVCVIARAEDRARLAAVVGDRSRPLKHIQRAWTVLHSADRLPVAEVARRAGVSRPAVWRWQRRFAEAGVEGLLRDKTRPPGKLPLPVETVAKVLALPCSEPPGEATYWTGRAVAEAVGVSLRAVQRIWEAHRLQPHRIRSFKKSNDPAFAEKVEDIVGLYMNPPTHAVVLSIDEKSQIQALDRTQPGLPMKPGKCGTMTHDYKRHGTTTLFAALNVLDAVPVAADAERNRIAVTIENHGGISADGDMLVRFMKEIASPWVRTCPDFGNWPADCDPCRETAKIIPYAAVVHAKMLEFDDRGNEANIDIPRMVGLLTELEQQVIADARSGWNEPLAERLRDEISDLAQGRKHR